MTSRGTTKRSAAMLQSMAAVALLGAAESLAQAGDPSGTVGAVQVTTFETAEGRVTVYLPADAAAGDTLSGTVVAEPAGATPRAKQRNADRLRGSVVEVAGHRAPVSGGGMTFQLPAGASAATAIVLRGAGGGELARRQLSVARVAASASAVIKPPTLGQAGHPVAIVGPFDGRFANSRVEIGGVGVQLLAESPRTLVVRAPLDVVGASQLRILEGAVEASGAFRNVAVGLTAARTDLAPGERQPMRIEVRGLAGLEVPIPLRITNESPQVVRLEGGDSQTVHIQPQDVDGDGRFETTRTITGVGSGSFGMRAELQPSEAVASGGDGEEDPEEPGPAAEPDGAGGTPEPSPQPSEPGGAARPGELVDPLLQPQPGGGVWQDRGPQQVGGPGAADVKVEDPAKVKAAREKLASLNARIDEAILGFAAGRLDKEGLEKAIEELHELKVQAIREFPSVWGLPFASWYVQFFDIDRSFLRARMDLIQDSPARVLLQLRIAGFYKDQLEGWLPTGEGMGVPRQQFSLRVSPNGLLLGEVYHCAADSDLVVTNPVTGREVARARTDAAGNAEIRQLDAPVRPGMILEIKCGPRTYRVTVAN